MTDNTAPPCIQERYTQAVHASSLKVEANRTGSADTLIAVAWSQSRVGALLMRLQTKADRTALEQAHQQLAQRAVAMGFERPDVVACAVLGWWLDHICKTCHGRKFEAIPDTPSLSKRPCKVCKGSGQTHLSYGSAGKGLVEWLDSCKERAMHSVRLRLHNTKM